MLVTRSQSECTEEQKDRPPLENQGVEGKSARKIDMVPLDDLIPKKENVMGGIKCYLV
jgi:hypothetical protein